MTNSEKLNAIEKKHGKKALVKAACDVALINVHKIKGHCRDDDYNLIVDALKNPHKINNTGVHKASYSAVYATVSGFFAVYAAASVVHYAVYAAVYADNVVYVNYAVKYALDAGVTQDQIDEILDKAAEEL